jgi:shikimate kinase
MQQHPKAEKKFKKRPLLKDLDSAARLFEQRLPLYRQVADIEVNVEGMSTPAISADILGTLG